MAEIKAFHALRFTPEAGDIKSLVCPPYDIISDAEREAYIEKNPYNIIRLELPRGEQPYEEAGATLKQFVGDGILKKDDAAGIYIYEEEFAAKGRTMSFKGFVCLVGLEPFSKGVVLPHEETLSKAKADRFNLMSTTFCNFSQIYSLYMDEKRETDTLLDKLSARTPDVEFTDGEGVVQRLWAVYDQDAIATIQKQFADRKLYIADGHHRYETALNFKNHVHEQGIDLGPDGSADYVMMMLVSMEHPGLLVLPTHRIVRDLEKFDKDAVLTSCAEYFDIEVRPDVATAEADLEVLYNEDKKAFAMYTGGDGYMLLTLRDEGVMEKLLADKSDAYRSLDVSVLHSLVLERLMGIDAANMANQVNLTYTKFAQEAVDAVRGGKANCAFLLNPTRVTQIRDVAAAGEKMPQKSTYFYPKLITGLVMNQFN